MLEKNLEEMTGVCQNCGTVDLLPNSKKTSYVCAVGRRGSSRSENKKSQHHGLTRAEARQLKENSLCQICGRGDNLVIDHSHTTMAIRGVLCTSCNVGLGMFKDNPEYLRLAIAYLATEA